MNTSWMYLGVLTPFKRLTWRVDNLVAQRNGVNADGGREQEPASRQDAHNSKGRASRKRTLDADPPATPKSNHGRGAIESRRGLPPTSRVMSIIIPSLLV